MRVLNNTNKTLFGSSTEDVKFDNFITYGEASFRDFQDKTIFAIDPVDGTIESNVDFSTNTISTDTNTLDIGKNAENVNIATDNSIASVNLGGLGSSEINHRGLTKTRDVEPMADNYNEIGKSSLAYKKMYSYSFENPSDEKIKKDISPIKEEENAIKKIRPVKYRYKNSDKIRYGFIANEVEKILPELVNNDGEIKTMNYIDLIPLIVSSIHHLNQNQNHQPNL